MDMRLRVHSIRAAHRYRIGRLYGRICTGPVTVPLALRQTSCTVRVRFGKLPYIAVKKRSLNPMHGCKVLKIVTINGNLNECSKSASSPTPTFGMIFALHMQ